MRGVTEVHVLVDDAMHSINPGQLLSISWMLTGYWSNYLESAYLFSNLVIQVPGYLLICGPTCGPDLWARSSALGSSLFDTWRGGCRECENRGSGPVRGRVER
jgi:hypothetical protein